MFRSTGRIIFRRIPVQIWPSLCTRPGSSKLFLRRRPRVKPSDSRRRFWKINFLGFMRAILLVIKFKDSPIPIVRRYQITLPDRSLRSESAFRGKRICSLSKKVSEAKGAMISSAPVIKSPPLWLCRIFGVVSPPIIRAGLDPGRALMQVFNPDLDVRRTGEGCCAHVGSYGLVGMQKNPLGTFVGFYPRRPGAF
jgi:hypothetical protein